MHIFWTRIILFSLLYLLVIYEASGFLALSILFYALCIGVYFLTSIRKALLWKYSALIILISLHSYLLTDTFLFTNILLLFVVIDASFRLNRNKLLGLIMLTSGILVLFQYGEQALTVEKTLFYLLIAFLILRVNIMTQERIQQRELYEALRNEYRRLKRMHLEAEENVRLQERTMIARDLHDSVGPRLTALIMKLEMLHIKEGGEMFGGLKQMARDSLEETRLAVKALQTEESEGISTVVSLIRKLEAESHLRIQFTMKQGVLSVKMTNAMNVVLYRVIQEALTNIMRHAETRDAHIILEKSPLDGISFEISNPQETAKPFTKGFGLTNMTKRVEELGGYLTVEQTEHQFIVLGMIPKEETADDTDFAR